MITVTVNGAVTQVAPASTVRDLVTRVAGDRSGVAVAVNDTVVPRTRWADTPIREHDRIEILTAVQGG